MKLKDLVKVAAPIAAGYFLGPAGAGIGNPMLTGAAAGGIGSLLTGGSTKDAMKAALLGGLGGAASGMGQPAATANAAGNVAPSVLRNDVALQEALRKKATEQAVQQSMQSGIGAVAPSAPTAKTMSGELLKNLGYAGEGEGNLLFKLMNTQMGEGLAAGLVAQLLAGDEEEEDRRGSFDQRAYGAGGPGGKLGGIMYAEDGGEAYFPRRNGGIDPSEGSGRKDDVPAMLMAGEFVMTRDAVKGAGDGNLRKGIDRMYNMMDQFERMA